MRIGICAKRRESRRFFIQIGSSNARRRAAQKAKFVGPLGGRSPPQSPSALAVQRKAYVEQLAVRAFGDVKIVRDERDSSERRPEKIFFERSTQPKRRVPGAAGRRSQ